MAEGGFDEFENPAFDRDDYDADVDDADMGAFLADLLGENQETQRIAEQQMESMEHLSAETLEDTRKKVIKKKVDNFTLVNKKRGGTPAIVNYGNFGIKDEILYVQPFGTSDEIPLEFKKGGIIRPLSLSYLARKYGTAFIRETLGFQDFVQKPKSARQAKQTLQELSTVEKNIQSKDVTDTIELQELTNTAAKADATVETMLTDWNLELPDVANKHTQTEGLTLRELRGLDKALQTTRGELVNNLAKLTELDKDIARNERKLQETEDETIKAEITARLKNLYDERSARLEAASANKEALRGQINRIKETLNKILKEDSTLGERLKTLFKEQGITIVSILTAIGMTIGVIVEAVIPGGGAAATPSPKLPPSQDGIKEWVKKQLHNLAKLLANLAGKAAAALPGIIGAIVSWLLSATGKVVNWFGNNLWALVVLVAGLLYAAAKEYINKSRK